ncbi:hypothetical protein ABIA32_000572 [Streptacidiphilus sp. MAP12-20]|uniref:anti-sigma factor antagonist n=1 Tax=Streptacidiphilus sp. MAP12-20 TaxID=3156299 RepID=UPI0035187B20
MTIQWHLTTRPTADVLQVTGYLGDSAVARFTGAVGWAVARGEGLLLLDLTHLKGWSEAGHAALTRAARQLSEQQRPLELVAHAPDGDRLAADCKVPWHPDLDTALAAHQHPRGTAAPEGPAGPVWHSSEWVDGGPHD